MTKHFALFNNIRHERHEAHVFDPVLLDFVVGGVGGVVTISHHHPLYAKHGVEDHSRMRQRHARRCTWLHSIISACLCPARRHWFVLSDASLRRAARSSGGSRDATTATSTNTTTPKPPTKMDSTQIAMLLPEEKKPQTYAKTHHPTRARAALTLRCHLSCAQVQAQSGPRPKREPTARWRAMEFPNDDRRKTHTLTHTSSTRCCCAREVCLCVCLCLCVVFCWWAKSACADSHHQPVCVNVVDDIIALPTLLSTSSPSSY